jgi:hypothetical protein
LALHPSKSRPVLLALLLGVTNAALAADAVSWREMAKMDLDAAHDAIVEAHPGVIDPENPAFNAWVEKGYEEAKAHLPFVLSYDTALAAVRYYTAGFEDGHLLYSDDIRQGFPVIVTGWNITGGNGQYTVASTIAGWKVALPPVGARWLGCDGQSADTVLRTRVGPFVTRQHGTKADASRVRMLWARRPIARDLQNCSFRLPDGETITLPVAYGVVTEDQFFAAMQSSGDGSSRLPNDLAVLDDVLWVRAANFTLRPGSGDQAELEILIRQLEAAAPARAIVFDARGNRGGDSGIGDQIFQAATGGLDLDGESINSLPRYYAQWRVSDYLIRYLTKSLEEIRALYGHASARVAADEQFFERVVVARGKGQPWVDQDAGRRITRRDVAARGGRLRRPVGHVLLLTDAGCVSACLDFADTVLQVPGSMHVGEKTGADSVYMVGSWSRLPSGNKLVLPVKVWRNRVRGNNEPLEPDVEVKLDRDEASIRAEVLSLISARRQAGPRASIRFGSEPALDPLSQPPLVTSTAEKYAQKGPRP